MNDCFDVCKLLLCGDIEENPGPSVNEMFERLLEGQKNIKDKLAEVKKRLEETEKTVNIFFESTVEKRVNEISVKADTLDKLTECVFSIDKTLKMHETKLVELEDCSRRNNLVFGIK